MIYDNDLVKFCKAVWPSSLEADRFYVNIETLAI